MDTPQQNEKPAAQTTKKAAPTKLPSKPISFSGQQQSKKGVKGTNSKTANSQKKGGVNLMRKLSGM